MKIKSVLILIVGFFVVLLLTGKFLIEARRKEQVIGFASVEYRTPVNSKGFSDSFDVDYNEVYSIRLVLTKKPDASGKAEGKNINTFKIEDGEELVSIKSKLRGVRFEIFSSDNTEKALLKINSLNEVISNSIYDKGDNKHILLGSLNMEEGVYLIRIEFPQLKLLDWTAEVIIGGAATGGELIF